MVILGQAIRRLDAGDGAGAAALAETALLHDHIDTRRMVTDLGLYLVAQADSSGRGWRRYAEHQARQRLQTHHEVLSAARAQLHFERSLLDTERSNRRAYLDELTGLANRHAYSRHLNRLRHGPGDDAVAVLMVDIDRFKSVNDRFGHAVGDEVLRRLGSMLLDLTRATDMAVRLGGDEFLLLLTGRGPMDVVDRAEQLVRQVADHEWEHTADGLTVSVSAGLSTGLAKDVARLLDAADRHLYAAKSGGRGRLVHDRPR
jgi:diguanylate cyclase (GGDEF)-like protein